MDGAIVRDYMTTDVVALRPDDRFKEIVRALADRGVSGAPVVDESGGAVGVVSEADLLHKEAFKTIGEETRRYFVSRSILRAARAKAAGDTAAAADDLAGATQVAARMVREFGLSPALGPVGYATGSPQYLGAPAEDVLRRPYSEQTQKIIDEETARLLRHAEERAIALETGW